MIADGTNLGYLPTNGWRGDFGIIGFLIYVHVV